MEPKDISFLIGYMTGVLVMLCPDLVLCVLIGLVGYVLSRLVSR